MGHRYHIRACDIEAEELTMTDGKKGPNTLDPREVRKSLTTEHLTTLIPAEKPSDPGAPTRITLLVNCVQGTFLPLDKGFS